MEHYKNEIDWEKYNGLMKTLGFTGFISAIKGIGNKYFGFEFSDADEVGADALLEDTEIGGNFGRKDSDAGKFYYSFLKNRSGMTEKEFNAYYDKNSRGSAFSRMFPNLKAMERQYPSLEKCPCLLPIFWALRLGKISVAVATRKRTVSNLPSDENESVKRRTELVKKLGMMK